MKQKRVLVFSGIICTIAVATVFAFLLGGKMRSYSSSEGNKPTPTEMPSPIEEPKTTEKPQGTPTPVPTATSVPTVAPTATNTPTPEPTATTASMETLTPTPTAINIPTPTSTPTPIPTNAPTPTPTSTPTPTNTPTPTPTNTPVPTATNTPTPSPSPCPISTPKPTATPTPTNAPPPTPAPSFKFSGSVSDVTLYNENPKEYKFKIQNETDEELYIDCTSSNDYVANVYMEELTSGYYEYKFVVIGRESGTADITFTIYGKDSTGKCNVVYDTKTIKVTVELEEVVTSPFVAYPVFETEWKYGTGVTVQMWSNGNREALLYVAGSGAMWTPREANATDIGWAPWHSYDFDGNIVEIHVAEGITRVEDLSMPAATVLNLPLTLKEIGDSCFKDGDYTSVIIPEGVERIEGGAFLHCDYLSSVQLPSTLKYIGGSAFEGRIAPQSSHNSLLREIFIPKSVTCIDYAAFGFRWDMVITLEEEIDISGFNPDWDLDTDYNY